MARSFRRRAPALADEGADSEPDYSQRQQPLQHGHHHSLGAALRQERSHQVNQRRYCATTVAETEEHSSDRVNSKQGRASGSWHRLEYEAMDILRYFTGRPISAQSISQPCHVAPET